MTTTRGRRMAATGAVLAALATLTGCQDSSGAEDPPTTTSSAAGTPSATGSESPEESPSSSVAPASGMEIGFGAFSLNAPEGWKPAEALKADWKKQVAEPGAADTTLYFSALTALNPDLPLDESAQVAIDTAEDFGLGRLKQQGTVMIDGVEFYRLVGKDGTTWIEEYGGPTVDDREMTLRLTFDKWAHPDRADREQIIASVLASVKIDGTTH